MRPPDRRTTRPGTTRRVRMLGHHYTSPGYYFVTICTHDRNQYFGTIRNGEIKLSAAGAMVSNTIAEFAVQFQTVSINSFVVMPNHVHVLIGLAVRISDEASIENLSDVVHWIKSTTHQRYRVGVRSHRWPSFNHKVWQERFHDHIVRKDDELEMLRTYIDTNVEMWEKDRFHDGFQDW